MLAMDHHSASLTEVVRYFGRDVSPDPTLIRYVVRGLRHESATLATSARDGIRLDYFCRIGVSSISKEVCQLRERSNEDKHFRQRIARLGERLMQIKTSKA